jgi:hypothetical protein
MIAIKISKQPRAETSYTDESSDDLILIKVLTRSQSQSRLPIPLPIIKKRKAKEISSSTTMISLYNVIAQLEHNK